MILALLLAAQAAPAIPPAPVRMRLRSSGLAWGQSRRPRGPSRSTNGSRKNAPREEVLTMRTSGTSVHAAARRSAPVALADVSFER